MGCNQNYAGAGSATSSKNNPGGNQSSCNGDCGMPRWSVSEPYINLHISDTPMSYKTSSGREIDFQFFYRQRAVKLLPDETTITNFPAIAEQAYGNYLAGANCGTNAFWSHGWNMSMVIQSSNSYSTTAFSQGYSALLYRADGGIENYTNGYGAYPKNASSQVTIQSVSSTGYPLVEEKENNWPVYTNQPTTDSNGIYWGDANVGVKLVYPDGSQDVFGLSCYPLFTQNYPTFPVQGLMQMRLLLTQRIDPQGRTTSLGYEKINYTNWWSDNAYQYDKPVYLGIYRLRYVVDEDGRTNTFIYNNHAPTNSYSISHTCFEDTGYFVASNAPSRNPYQVAEIDDPYGRKVQLGYDLVSGILTNITDAAGLVSYFQYEAPTITKTELVPDPQNLCQAGGVCQAFVTGLASGGRCWITNLITPYGNTSFSYYEVNDSTVTEGVQQRAIYVNEPTGAKQLYFYIHKGYGTNGQALFATTAQAPVVPGQTNFDDGTSGTVHPTLEYRNSVHWGRRQFAALSTNVQVLLPGSFSNALANLTVNDFRKGRVRNWLWQADSASISESLSSEIDPSPDAAGQIAGERTWYNYQGKASPELAGNPQISCIARILPNGTNQYITYNFYPITGILGYPVGTGMVSDNEASFSKSDGTIGVLTNWYHYANNSVDLISISNSAGQYVNLGYNNYHQVTAATNALGQVTSLGWDEGNTWNLTGVSFPNGTSVSLQYYWPWPYNPPPPEQVNMLQEITVQPVGRTITINDYAAGLASSITDDRGLTISNTWDGLNRLTGTVFPDNTTVSNIYYRLDLVASKDRLTNWTYYAYDGLQHWTAVTNANHAVTSYGWCGCGSLTAILDALTNLTQLNYDNQGNLTNIVYPDFSSLTWRYDLAGRMTNVSDGLGRSLTVAYNNQSLPTSISSANGILQSVIYDALNRPINITDANGVTVTNQYDALNQLLKRTWPDGISEGYGYSAAGLIAYTNRNGKPTLYGRDGAGRLTSVTNANLEVTQFGYDSLNDVVSLVDGLLHQTTWQYNEYGWLTNKVDGLNRTAFSYAYNANGWVTNRWTPEKGNTIYTYDNVGNVTTVTYPQRTNSYAYDALNRLTNMVDAIGTHVFGYMAASLLQSETGPWASDTVTFGYAQGLRTALTLAQSGTNWSQSYAYDAGWRMTNTVSPAGAFNYGYAFQPSSTLVSSIGLPNAASITNGYDRLGRLTQTALNNYWGYTLDGYGYTPDALGLRTNILRNLGLTNSTVTAGYDNIGQLTSWAAREGSGVPRWNEQLAWAYDGAHNLHTRNNGNLAQTFTTDAANQLTNITRTGTFTLSGATPAPATTVTVNGQSAQTYGDFTFARTNLSLANGNNTFTNIAQNVYGVRATNTLTVNLPTSVSLAYDNNGNLTNDGTRSFAYDAENQLTNVTVAGSWRSDFVYDGLNRRRIERDFVWQAGAWMQTNETHLIYDGNLILQERDASNHVVVTYTRGLDLSGSLQYAGGIGGLLSRTDTNGATYYHADGSANVTALMDASQSIVARYIYNPFGQLVGRSGILADANEMQFSSIQRHSLSGLTLYTYRGYNPSLQRWLTIDSEGENGGYNLYRFTYNNPVSLVDSDGRFLPLIIGAFVVGAVLAEEPANAPGIGDQGLPMLNFGDQLEAGAGSALTAGLTVGIFKGGGAIANKIGGKTSCPLVPVSRWGSPGLKPGDWVMKGEVSRLNYSLSGKYQPEWFPTFGQPPNIPATYSSGVTYNVPPASLSFPPGLLGPLKGLVGQRIYNP